MPFALESNAIISLFSLGTFGNVVILFNPSFLKSDNFSASQSLIPEEKDPMTLQK